MSSDTSLKDLGFPRVDKLCTAGFINKIVKSTKKDFSLFVSENEELNAFFQKIEETLDEYDDKILQDIQEYLESIPEDVLKFKNRVKELKRQRKLKEDKLKEEMIIAKFLKSEEDKKKKLEMEQKLGVEPIKMKRIKQEDSSDNHDDLLDLHSNDTKVKQILEASTTLKKVSSIPKNVDENGNYKVSLDLNEFYEFLKLVVKNDMLIIKTDKGKLNIKDIDLDDDKIRIKVE